MEPRKGWFWDDPQYWLMRAEESRTLADQMSDPRAKQAMLRMAEEYDELAAHSQKRTRP